MLSAVTFIRGYFLSQLINQITNSYVHTKSENSYVSHLTNIDNIYDFCTSGHVNKIQVRIILLDLRLLKQ